MPTDLVDLALSPRTSFLAAVRALDAIRVAVRQEWVDGRLSAAELADELDRRWMRVLEGTCSSSS